MAADDVTVTETETDGGVTDAVTDGSTSTGGAPLTPRGAEPEAGAPEVRLG